MLPFEPEDRERLEARFSLALTPVYDVSNCVAGVGPFPGLLRRHVFDFENGLRMIVSVDTDGTLEYVHFSFGLHPGCALDAQQMLDYSRGVIEEFWRKDFKVVHRELTPHALHVCCDPD